MRKTSIAFLGVGLLGACLILAAKVTTDYSHSANFGQYHTYYWAKVKAGDQLWEDRIQRDVDQQLAAKGWQRVPQGGDVAVTAFGSTQNEQTLNTFYDDFGGWYWGGFGEGMSTTTTETTPVGTLVVDLFDAHTKHLIWRSKATDTLSDKPQKNEKKLSDTIDDMFKKFPPPSRG